MSEPKSKLELLATTVQVLSVVAGVVISALSFNATKQREAEARKVEAEKPFQELRRSVYLEAVKTAAVIANPEGRPSEEVTRAKRRFRELYVAELSMVESPEVAQRMVGLATSVDPDLTRLTPAQTAALELAHALGSSYAKSTSPARE